jgi:NAD(P)-dependent dehydrogenase (short-subunit alcohol dehydrogenase family)
MDPKGHAAIVTGAASGLGAETATALANAGAKVACLDLNLDGAKATAAKIGGIAIACDVTSSDSAEAAVKEAVEKHGTARILVNCAGIGPAQRMVGRDGPMPLATFEKVIAINLTGTFNMMRLCAAGMQTLSPFADGERGVIVSTASVAAFDGQIGQPAYAASKGGVAALTLPAARELSQFGIRVMTIAPGIFGTPMLRSLPQAAQDSLGASVPFPKRLGEPREYADLVLFIVRSGYLNGEVIRLDGALRMAPR